MDAPFILVLDDEQWEELLYDIANPKPPTQAILDGCKLLEQLAAQREEVNKQNVAIPVNSTHQ